MRRLGISILASTALFASCGGDRSAGGREGRPASDTAAMAGMQGMEDMPGMAGMPGMGAESAGVQMDRAEAARLGITFTRAAERPVRPFIRAVGTLKYAEPRQVYVNARVGGWVERLYADYVGRSVAAGEPLVALYSPDLVSAQEEYLLARRLEDDSLAATARRRLALWDVPDDQIDSLVARGTVSRTILLRAPRSGEIVEKMVIEGQAVQAGDNLFRIADRDLLWVDLAIFEQDAAAVRVGSQAAIRVDAVPGRTFRGRVTFIYPELDERTRTLTARSEVENPGRALRPGMYASAEIVTAGRRVVSIPLAAVLPTGTSDIVFVNRGDGRFVPREVRVGLRGDSLVEIAQGLAPGDEIVASATFLLDSESNLAAAMAGIMLQMGTGLNMGGMGSEGGEMRGMDMPQRPRRQDTMPGMRIEGLRRDPGAAPSAAPGRRRP